MAPVRSIKSHLAVRKPSSGDGASKPNPTINDARASKRDKRVTKHASFVSRIEKNAHKSQKRRRASKKLAANLESLADALPETQTEDPGQANIIKQTTLRHKPGALKRKQQIEKTERDRFGMNMAQLSGKPAPGESKPASNADQASTSNRWAALRNFVSQTMEQQPVFKDNK